MAPSQPAVLDTSFWTVGHRADVLQYMFREFTVHVPPAVRDEVLRVDARYPRRRYGYAELFHLLERQGLLRTVAPAQVASRFGRGEAEALGLAEQHGWRLLINDRRPLSYARQVGIRTTTVPGFILRLYMYEAISLASAERKLGLIEAVTSPSVLQPVRRALDQMARRRAER
jgi:predicted nucleic acid-binding protein